MGKQYLGLPYIYLLALCLGGFGRMRARTHLAFLRVCVPVVRVRYGAWLCVAVRAVREVVVASSSCRSRTVRKYTLDRFFWRVYFT